MCVTGQLSAQLSRLLGDQFLHYALDTHLGFFLRLKRCIKLLGFPLLFQGGLWHSYIWWEYFEATMNTRVLSVFKWLLRQCHCVGRWYLIVLLWRQWEVRHPYFPLCFGALWKGVGWKTFFSCSSEAVTANTELSRLSLVLCCNSFGSQSEELLPWMQVPHESIVNLGIKAVLRLPCSSWEKHSGQACGRLFAFPLLFPQTC